MKIRTFVIGMMQTNCYVASDEETKTCFLVDPACDAGEILQYIQEQELKLTAVLLTHGHFDHIMGIDSYLKIYSAPVYAQEEERLLLEQAAYNMSSMWGSAYTYTQAVYVRDGQELDLLGEKVKVIHTPGHTQGGCCYYIEKEGILFSGDTLFCRTVGRTDFPTGSMSKLIRSVREKLFVLPEDTVVYPGHMEMTTIGYEKRYNEIV